VLSGNTPQFHANLAANLFATIARGGGKILATPRVLAVNGTPAQILTGDALPIITTTTFPGPPIVTQQTVTYIAVGVNLQIQPRITQDGFVTSHIYAEVSSVTAFIPTQQGNVPQISLRQTSTTATVADGQPFAVGGLLKDEEIENMSRVPGLGSLPIIGGLFRVRHDTATKTNLFIFITPHVIRQVGTSNYTVPSEQLPKPQVPGPHPAPQTPAPSPTPAASASPSP
jgi:general secretion pathway protein D